MPALAFLAVVGLALIAMLFVASATLENGSPPIVTSNRVGLPEPWHPDSTDPDLIRNLPTAPAPRTDMTSNLARAAMPNAQSAPEEDPANVKPAARAARAEAPPRGSVLSDAAEYGEQHLVASRGARVGPVLFRPLLNRVVE